MITKQKIFFTLLALGVLWIILPFISYLAMGGIFAVLAYSPYAYLLEKRKWSSARALVTVTLGVLVLVLLPLFVLIFSGVRAASQQLPKVMQFFEAMVHEQRDPGGGFLDKLWEKLGVPPLIETTNLNAYALDFIKTAGTRLTGFLGDIAAGIPSTALGIVMMIVGMALCLHYAKVISELFRRHSFFDESGTERLITVFRNTTRSIFVATIVTGIVQSIVFSLGCLLLGVKNVVLVGFLVFIGSLIPAGGTMPVTLTIGVYKLLTGPTHVGIILLVLAVAVSFIDNLLRPLMLRSGVQIDALLSFVAILSGLVTFGFPGLFLGPIAFILFGEVYRMTFPAKEPVQTPAPVSTVGPE